VFSVAFTSDRNRLVSGSLDNLLKYWHVSVLVNGGASGGGAENGPGGAESERRDGTGGQYTMNFTGHEVIAYFISVER
jgi:WD40 repeat protein